jgi:transcriptional antiterminator
VIKLSEQEYIVNKVLNNNVILAFDKIKKDEVVLVEKGIGFGKKKGQVIDLSKTGIKKIFLSFDESAKREYYELVNKLDGEVIGVSEEIIAIAEEKFGSLNAHIHIALTDHISFCIERLKSGFEIGNPFIYEIKALYADEFRIGEKAAALIKDRLGVEIPESEIGFIALHIHAARQNKKVGETIKDTKLLMDLVNIIEKELSVNIHDTGLTYSRLINHLRASISRMEERKYIKNPLLDTIKEQFKESYKIASKLGEYIEKTKKIYVSDDELGYLALHIERIKEVKKCVTESNQA